MIGFDKFGINNLLYLSLPFTEGQGVIAHDISKRQIPGILSGGGPTWENYALSGIPYLGLDAANPDWVECAAAHNELDFTAGDFTLLAWVYTDDMTLNRTLFCRGLLDTDGYHCTVLINGEIVLFTNQGGDNQNSMSAVGSVTVATWYLVGFTRSGASVRCFNNGIDVTDVEGAHVNPLTSARDLHIGTYDTEAANTSWHGHLWNPRIWARQLSAAEMNLIWEYERPFFGA